MRRAMILLMITSCWLAIAGPLQAAERAALVIGNADYEVGPLANPVNDATDMAAALRALDFDVTVATNLDRAGMLQQIDAFRKKIQPGGLALVFYAGHGVELGGDNWLLPVRNRAIGTQAQVRIHSVSARDVLQAMEEGGARLNVLILDACRDNPLPAGARSTSRGLVPISTGSSTLVAYSTSPGRIAADGDGRNSPYTAALVRALKQPQVQVPDLFNQVGAEVLQSTGGAQVPWNSNTPIWPPIVIDRKSKACSKRGELGASIEAEEDRIECEVERVNSLQAYAIDASGNVSSHASQRFPLGSRVALCVTLPEPLYFSVWDAPPQGEVERLYPNARSHPAPTPVAVRAPPGLPTCIGLPGSGYKVSIDDAEGRGRGQFLLVATRTLADHPTKGSFFAANWKEVYASIEVEGDARTLVPTQLLQEQPGVADTVLVYEVY